MVSFYERSCDHCRKLKIRCDRVQPSCKNCSRRHLKCTRNKPLLKRGPKPKSTKSRVKKHSQLSFNPDQQLSSNDTDEFFSNRASDIEVSLTCDEFDDASSLSSLELDNLDHHQDLLTTDSHPPSEIEAILSTSDSDDLMDPPQTEFTIGQDYDVVNQLPKESIVEPSLPKLSELSFTSGNNLVYSLYGYSDQYNRIDTPSTVNATIYNDMIRFELILKRRLPELLNPQQVDYVLYYFTHIQTHLPLISQQKFLNLLNHFTTNQSNSNLHPSPHHSNQPFHPSPHHSNQPSHPSPHHSQPSPHHSNHHPSNPYHHSPSSTDFDFPTQFKLLLSTLCQISYLYALNPNIFKHSILTFLTQSNLDILFSGTINLMKLPTILTNAFTMLIRYHLAAAAF